MRQQFLCFCDNTLLFSKWGNWYKEITDVLCRYMNYYVSCCNISFLFYTKWTCHIVDKIKRIYLKYACQYLLF